MIFFLDVHYWDKDMNHKVKSIPFTMYEADAQMLSLFRVRTIDGLDLGEIRLTVSPSGEPCEE